MMCLVMRRFAMIVLASLTPEASALRAADLQAGVAKATITPDVKAAKVYMAGFDNNRAATGVHDDLYVRCLALGAGHRTLALCAVDASACVLTTSYTPQPGDPTPTPLPAGEGSRCVGRHQPGSSFGGLAAGRLLAGAVSLGYARLRCSLPEH
jgi:hypothetical protein